jgi:hypothetical protein
MVASLVKQISQNLTTLVHLFHKNPLNELHWIIFFFLAKIGLFLSLAKIDQAKK